MNKNHSISLEAFSGTVQVSPEPDLNPTGYLVRTSGRATPPRQPATRQGYRVLFAAYIFLAASFAGPASTSAQDVVLQLDPGGTEAEIRLTGNFHTIEGSFAYKRGTIHYAPVTGAASGEVVFDATSGKTGNSSRDKKMHKDVLASERYPEIVFRPDHAEGTLASSGESTLQVHGLFRIHGSEHEVTIPVQMNVRGATWSAQASFTIPYRKWGMKNPSVLFLRVNDEVQVQFHAEGSMTR